MLRDHTTTNVSLFRNSLNLKPEFPSEFTPKRRHRTASSFPNSFRIRILCVNKAFDCPCWCESPVVCNRDSAFPVSILLHKSATAWHLSALQLFGRAAESGAAFMPHAHQTRRDKRSRRKSYCKNRTVHTAGNEQCMTQATKWDLAPCFSHCAVVVRCVQCA